MAINTGMKSTSFQVWGATFISGLAAEVYAFSSHHIPSAFAGIALQAVAGLIKTFHDHGLKATEIKAAADVQEAFYYALPKGALVQTSPGPAPVVPPVS